MQKRLLLKRLLGLVPLSSKSSTLLLLGVTLLLAGCGSLPQQSFWQNFGFGHSASPPSEEARLQAWQAEQLYQEVWQTVFREYVDGKFNGQDWYRWKDHFHGQLKDKDDAQVAIDTMLASLNDEYTRFLQPRDMKEQTLYIDSKLSGVGLQIAVRDGKLIVVSALDDTPASRVDIHSEDVITHINGKPAAGLPVEEAADRIRGPVGTQVTLRILRGQKTFDLSIKRAEIKLKSVFTREVTPNTIGYVRLNSFISETATEELRAAMTKLANKKAIILDLRGNYGGLLSNAVEIADLFLDDGVIVSVQGRRKEDRQEFEAEKGEITHRPMVLLIDGGSASASEILSGALHDHHRAKLIGETTFGKGLVQKINSLSDGSGLNITVARYLTPNGSDIHKKGIPPDIAVDFKLSDLKKNKDPQLDRAIGYLSASYSLAATSAVPEKQ